MHRLKQPTREKLILNFISFAVAGNGLVIIAANLGHQLHIHNSTNVSELIVTVPLISGLTLVYLGGLLHRRKRAAWAMAIPLYTFILGSGLNQLEDWHGHHWALPILRNFILPLIIVAALLYYRAVFRVKSNLQNFRFALTITGLILLVAFAYGVAGYLLLERSDFKVDISLPQAMHRTIDQFDFTTPSQLVPATKRAAFFLDSLNILSFVAVGYGVISLFQPIKARLSSQTLNRLAVEKLLREYPRNSEDFFKLWPHDKTYFIIYRQGQPTAALAYRLQRGVALVVSEPIGNPVAFKRLLKQFSELCYLNDWLLSFIHISNLQNQLFLDVGLQLQKIGEEAVVNVAEFQTNTIRSKYFRQIGNRFKSHQYTSEWLSPPHSIETLGQLTNISAEWLESPGRVERGFMLGHFSDAYLQKCRILIARDSKGQIQGFLNVVPSFQKHQTSYDMLRSSKQALGNINDFLLMGFISQAHLEHFKEVNLGLCPLSGVDKEERSLLSSGLQLVYTNGDRFYSFSGLKRFKAKYQPNWQSRYIAYRGGVRGFSRVVLALNKAMSRLK